MFSDCDTYRYRLWRQWGRGDTVAFIMLNPSTADHTADDPTVRRCIHYAKSWGYGRLEVINLFACRATEPKILRAAADPIGPKNDSIIIDVATAAHFIIAAWGNHGVYQHRDIEVLNLLRRYAVEVHCLQISKRGCPQHPLYLPGKIVPALYRPIEEP